LAIHQATSVGRISTRTMKNPAFGRAMAALSHPLSVAGVVTLLLNDHLLRRAWPSWWSGKIGDVAWLLFAPFVLAAGLAWLLPRGIQHRETAVGGLALWLTGLGFAAAKTLPLVHATTVALLARIYNTPVALLADPSDLLATPALLAGWVIWKRDTGPPAAVPPRAWLVLVLAALATMANSPAADSGITCLIQEGSTVLAYGGAWRTGGYLSTNGGLTWQETTQAVVCEGHQEPWQFQDPLNQKAWYRVTPGSGIEWSEEGGEAWRREVDLSGQEARYAYYEREHTWIHWKPAPSDALVDPGTGNLIAAMGVEGALIRTPDGEWTWAAVGPYRHVEMRRLDQLWLLLWGELWLAVTVLFATLFTVSATLVQRRKLETVTEAACWILLGISILGVRYISFPYLQFPVVCVLILVSFLPAAVGLTAVWRVYHHARSAVGIVAVTALGTACLFFLPYLLWSQGAIPHYNTAALFAALLVAASLFAGRRYVHHLFETEGRHLTTDDGEHKASGEPEPAEDEGQRQT
jgi:hypothetical protein